MILLLGLLFAVLIALEIAIQQQVLIPSFAELERDDASTSMKRIDSALTMTLAGLESAATDWGNWADVYHFVQQPTPAFASANITPVALKQLQINLLMIVDLNGAVMLSDARDLDTGELLNLDLLSAKSLPRDFPWRGNFSSGEAARGLIRTDRGVMMIAAGPVLDGSGKGQSLGAVIMGKLLTPADVSRIGAQAQADLIMHRDAAGEGEHLVETETKTEVYRTFADIYGKPLMTLQVDVPRKITERGQRAVSYASAYLIGVGLAALALVVAVMNRLVLNPLAQVTRHAVAIGDGADLSARLNLPGRDEIAVLAREFDRMVESVEASRRQLVDQSFQSGFAELARGVLHNLGNAMTPLGVRLAKLSDRLRDAPVADVAFATAQLQAGTADVQRRADLEQFLHLGARQLSGVIEEARADAAVIQRQTSIVQTALNELMRSTRNEHVVESVRLPDLVSQTLEIVPDACRQRLIVEADESLRRVGVVYVARTVLRLVLQNLIINAADSVRDAGRDRGLLRVAAEIVREDDREQLHLSCEDNGIGISADNLGRVFDQGFSTKSRDTNYGIGLHWCANALAALGGRIWASSDGPGRGASLHLLLPLAIRERQTLA